MRSKRRKPDRFGHRRFEREFGWQIDADLPENQPEHQPEDTTHPSESRKIPASRKAWCATRQRVNPGFCCPDEVEAADPSVPERESGFGQTPADEEPPVVSRPEVLEQAVRLLANREHGRKELEQKLLQRDLPLDLIVSVLDQLAQEGLQCDVRFAESYVRMRVDRGYGANKIRADLQTRRLQQSVVEEAIIDSGTDWGTVADAALAKKFGGFSAQDMKTRAKMQRFLYQRGFEAEEIRSAMNNYPSVDSEL